MDKVNKIAQQHLGRPARMQESYNPDLLVTIPRSLNRQTLIREQTLPFCGYDIWNAYEVSALTHKGLPVNAILKLAVPADSPNMLESKSFKLYLNSFNFSRLGNTRAQCLEAMRLYITRDIERCLGATIHCAVHRYDNSQPPDPAAGVPALEELINLDNIDFDHQFPDTLACSAGPQPQTFRFTTDLLRSNCRVTGQPDWGDIICHLESCYPPDYAAIARYIVSQRRINHFHEEVAEMLFDAFATAFQPRKLMILCRYTRRGGIDINPIRSTHADLLPDSFIDVTFPHPKTPRQ